MIKDASSSFVLSLKILRFTLAKEKKWIAIYSLEFSVEAKIPLDYSFMTWHRQYAFNFLLFIGANLPVMPK